MVINTIEVTATSINEVDVTPPSPVVVAVPHIVGYADNYLALSTGGVISCTETAAQIAALIAAA